jgi:hypothetical protein
MNYMACSYDIKENVFVDGQNSSGSFQLAEISQGSNKLVNVKLNQAIGYPGGIRWSGKFLAIMDSDSSVIYRFAINDSHQGFVAGSTQLDASQFVQQFWIGGKRLVGADTSADIVWLWHYPGGGDPFNSLTNLGSVYGVTVSSAPSGSRIRK